MKASTILINILVLSSLTTAMSCNEEEQHGQKVRTIMATIEQSSTRTALDGPDADGVYKTIWSSEDAIAVFSGNDSATEFKLTSGANTNTAEFEGNTASDNMVAVYPYSIVKGRTGSTISVTLPEVQEYVSGNIPQGAYPMAAVSDGAILPFYNLCSVLRLRMFGDLTVNSITFTPNDATIKTSGNATVNAGDKMLTMSGDAKSTVRLNCANGVKLTKTNTDFLMVVPAQKYTGGFTITISTDHGEVTKAVKSDVTLSRSVLYPVKTFECKIDDSKDNIVFEDANFKAYLIKNFDNDNDGEISREEALEVTDINVCSDDIESLAGIEYMANLETLRCRGTYNTRPWKLNGSLKTIDVSHNKKLKLLNVGYNVLTGIDVSGNAELAELLCEVNNLASLDTRSNDKLTRLICSDNSLETINLNQNKLLRTVLIDGNSLSSLDVTNNEKLDTLICLSNAISNLDLKYNTSLVYLDCSGCGLSSLDLSHNANLEYLRMAFNNIATIDVSKCTKLKTFLCGDNNLTSTLDVSKCTELTVLQCFRNSISHIIMTPSTNLYNLYCGENELESLDVSTNTGLKDFSCFGNKLNSLDVSHNKLLYAIDCSRNNLERLDVTSNIKLQYLDCYGNNLKGLDITHNPELYSLYCNDNEIVSLDICNNKVLTWLYCQDNPLKTLYAFKGQYDAIKYKKIPDFTQIIESVIPGGNNDTTTGDKIRLE